MDQLPPATPPVGLREAGKAERRRRLTEATRRLMLARGYDATTTREISQAAGVSIGTLFVYAKDKRDLLYLVINDELEPVAARAHAGVPRNAEPLDRMIVLLTPWYAYFAANLTLGRWAFREVTYYQHNPDDVDDQAVRLRVRLRGQEAHLRCIMDEARTDGALAFDEPPALIASTLYDIYGAEIRRWLYGVTPTVPEGLAALRAKFALLLDRMAARGHDRR